jgi:hypothetical protein
MDTVEQRALIGANIERHGWHCVHVFAELDGEEPFSYTIGFAERHSAPEVLVFGLPQDKAHAVLARCSALLAAGHALQPGVDDARVLANGLPVQFRTLRADRHDDYLGRAQVYYGERPFDALVLFWPDRLQRLPWQPGYDAPAQHEALAAALPA